MKIGLQKWYYHQLHMLFTLAHFKIPQLSLDKDILFYVAQFGIKMLVRGGRKSEGKSMHFHAPCMHFLIDRVKGISAFRNCLYHPMLRQDFQGDRLKVRRFNSCALNIYMIWSWYVVSKLSNGLNQMFTVKVIMSRWKLKWPRSGQDTCQVDMSGEYGTVAIYIFQ